MPRRIGKVDLNQPRLVKQMRMIPGMVVRSTASVGDGFPDVVCGYRGRNYMFEIKNPDLKPSERKLTPDELEFFEKWTGQVDVVETIEDVVTIINRKER